MAYILTSLSILTGILFTGILSAGVTKYPYPWQPTPPLPLLENPVSASESAPVKLVCEFDIDTLVAVEKPRGNQVWADVQEIDAATYPILGPSFVAHKSLINITHELIINESMWHKN